MTVAVMNKKEKHKLKYLTKVTVSKTPIKQSLKLDRAIKQKTVKQ